jgi:hypothetical protein
LWSLSRARAAPLDPRLSLGRSRPLRSGCAAIEVERAGAIRERHCAASRVLELRDAVRGCSNGAQLPSACTLRRRTNVVRRCLPLIAFVACASPYGSDAASAEGAMSGRDPASEPGVLQAAALPASTLASAQDCLDEAAADAEGRIVCELPPGTIDLDGSSFGKRGRRSIQVTRAGTVLRGAATILRRRALDITPLVEVVAQRVRIEGLTLDGHRFAFTTDEEGKAIPAGCFGENREIYDIDIARDAQVEITDVKLYNAIGTSVRVSGSGSRLTRLDVRTSRSTGIHVWADDVVIEDSRFEDNGTAAITVHGKRARVVNDVLFENRHEQPDGVAGGQLNLEPESEDAVVADNVIDGAFIALRAGNVVVTDPLDHQAYACPVYLAPDNHFPIGSNGIEGYGLRHTLENNRVFHHDGGMLLKGTIGWSLTRNTVTENDYGIIFLRHEDRANTGVVLHANTISASAKDGLRLEEMATSADGRGGCTETRLEANGNDVVIGAAVAAEYRDSCR